MLHHLRHVLCGGAARQRWPVSRCQGGSSRRKPYRESCFDCGHKCTTFAFYNIFIRLLVHIISFLFFNDRVVQSSFNILGENSSYWHYCQLFISVSVVIYVENDYTRFVLFILLLRSSSPSGRRTLMSFPNI